MDLKLKHHAAHITRTTNCTFSLGHQVKTVQHEVHSRHSGIVLLFHVNDPPSSSIIMSMLLKINTKKGSRRFVQDHVCKHSSALYPEPSTHPLPPTLRLTCMVANQQRACGGSMLLCFFFFLVLLYIEFLFLACFKFCCFYAS